VILEDKNRFLFYQGGYTADDFPDKKGKSYSQTEDSAEQSQSEGGQETHREKPSSPERGGWKRVIRLPAEALL
jgi:hypothetical protein